MSKEQEVVTYLRTDTALGTLAPGGIYAHSDLDERGLTDAVAMPDVWAGGTFQTTIVVRERAPVPTGDLQDVMLQHTSMSQAVEVWVYDRNAGTIQAVLDRVYTLMMGAKIDGSFSATMAGGAPLGPAPELPSGVYTRHEDYRLIFIRRPATA